MLKQGEWRLTFFFYIFVSDFTMWHEENTAEYKQKNNKILVIKELSIFFM